MSSSTAAPALSSTNLEQALRRLATSYTTNTPTRLKLVDSFLLFVLVSGVLVFSYCVLAGSFPYNSFLAGFISTVGTFVLAGPSRTRVGKRLAAL
jgi:oligosaccharyltransferase complex subunit epsilon